MTWVPLLGLAVTLAILLLTERWIHRHLQGTMLLLTGDQEVAVVLYALPLMPGILLHEVSHAFVAKTLGARVGRVSIRPTLAEERIRLGFVPVEETDAVRGSLIGLAPLLAGSAVILLIGYLAFDIGTMQRALVEADWSSTVTALAGMLKARDMWLWLYLIFAISNTMLPSKSDRRSWTPIVLFLILAVALAWIAGLGPAIVSRFGQPLELAMSWLVVVYGFTIVADLPFVLLIALVERILARTKGVRVDY